MLPESDKRLFLKTTMHSPIRRSLPLIFLACAALLLPGGVSAEETGFRFPGGDAEAGRETFVALNCVQCHTVAGTKLPEPQTPRRLELALAEQIRFAKRYEGLVVAITNPRHVVAEQYRAILTAAEAKGGIEPFMPDLTRDMSARQLMDLVAFLDEAYRRELKDYGK